MADNTTLNSGSGGDTIATDDIAGVKHQRVKIEYGVDGSATDVSDTNPLPIDDAGGSLTVDGTVTAELSATDNAVLDQLELNTSYGDSTGGGTEAAALRVTIANDSTGLVSIDDNGGSITVDGTISETNSAAILADTANMDTNLGTLAGAVTGTEMQVDVVAPLPAGTNNIGDVDIASSVALDVSAATVTVDLGANNDVVSAGDIAHDAADSGNPIKTGSKAVLFNSSAPPNAAAAEGDRVNHIADEYGRQYVETTHPNYWDASVDYAVAQTNTTVKAAPGAGLSLYITDIIISNGATAGNITLLDGSGGTVLLEIYPAINGGLTHSFKSPIKLTANTLLAITSTTVTTHSATVAGFIAP